MILKNQIAQLALSSRADRQSLFVPRHKVHFLDLVTAGRLEIFRVDRCSQEDPSPGCAAVEVGDNQKLLRRKQFGIGKVRAATVGQLVPTDGAGLPLRDSVGIGERENLAEPIEAVLASGRPLTTRDVEPPGPLLGIPSRALAYRPINRQPVPTLRMSVQCVQAEAKVRIMPTRRAFEDVALAQQGGNVARQIAHPKCCSSQDHVRQAGMEGQFGHLLPVRGDPSLAIDCAQPCQQLPGLAEGAGGRSIQPQQLGNIRSAPQSQLQGEWCEIRVQDFGRSPG